MRGAPPIHGTLLRDLELRIPNDLPQVIVWILKVTGVPSPEGDMRGFNNLGASSPCLRHDRVDLFLRADIMANGDFGWAAGGSGDASVVRDAVARPYC